MDFVINSRETLINREQFLIELLPGFIQADVVIFAGKQRIAALAMLLVCASRMKLRIFFEIKISIASP